MKLVGVANGSSSTATLIVCHSSTVTFWSRSKAVMVSFKLWMEEDSYSYWNNYRRERTHTGTPCNYRLERTHIGTKCNYRWERTHTGTTCNHRLERTHTGTTHNHMGQGGPQPSPTEVQLRRDYSPSQRTGDKATPGFNFQAPTVQMLSV